MVEPWLMLTQYEPKTPWLDWSVVSVITQSIQRDSEFTQVEEGVSVLLIQIMTKYQRFHDFRAQLLADEHSVVSDFAKAVQWKVTNLG